MRVGVALVAIAALAAPSYADAPIQTRTRIEGKSVKLSRHVVAGYDRFKDQGTVVSSMKRLAAGRMWLDFAVVFTFQGDSLVAPTEVFFRFVHRGEDWRFLRDSERSLIYLDGDARVELKILGHRGDVLSGGLVNEIMIAVADVETALRILETDPPARLGNVEFRLGSATGPSSEICTLIRHLQSR